MKIFRVVTERDGATFKQTGEVKTEIVREELRYVANTIQEVWDEIAWIRADSEKTLLAVHEESPAVTVLANTAHKRQE